MNFLIGLQEVIEALQELERLHQLNIELLEQLDVACGWLLDNHIQLPNASTFCSLLTKSKALLKEIQATEPKTWQIAKIADEKKHLNRTDEEVPAPKQQLN